MTKKPVEKEVVIEKLAFGGDGVGRIDGKVVFVPLTIPGEKVRVHIVKNEGKFDRGELLKVVLPSADRIEPRCSVFGECGGCQWQHMTYESQLLAKETILYDILERSLPQKNFKKKSILACDHPWEYRSRLQLKSDGCHVGQYGRKNHRVVPFDRCEIAQPLINDRVKEIQERHEECGEEFELLVNEDGNLEQWPLPDSHRVFSQVNPSQNRRLREVVLHFVFGRAEKMFTQKKNIVELYAGGGNLTFALAESAGIVVAVESNKQAAEKIIETSIEKRIHNVECIPGTAEWGLKKIIRRKLPVDELILDPPRGGAREILDLILVLKPRRIVYVSCEPMTLARDLRVLSRDYRLERVQPIDMFPQTYHIESVSELVRKS